MLGCDCGGTKYDEEHADDCAGWRLELAAERAAHLATRQELSVALAQRHVLVDAAVRATIEACAFVPDEEFACKAILALDPAPIVARVLGGGE